MKNAMSSSWLFSTLALLGIIAIVVVININGAGKENVASTSKIFEFSKDLKHQHQHRYLKQPVLVFSELSPPESCDTVRCADPCSESAAVDACGGSCVECTNGRGCTATCTAGNKVCAGWECSSSATIM